MVPVSVIERTQAQKMAKKGGVNWRFAVFVNVRTGCDHAVE
jgi:hypothetical protein